QAREALAQLRETLGGEVPELEGLLGSPGGGTGVATEPSTDPADLKLIEVANLKLLPLDIDEFRLTPTLELELHNTSKKTLAAFSLKCELKSPDRDIPWAAATLTHRIPGGLLPG